MIRALLVLCLLIPSAQGAEPSRRHAKLRRPDVKVAVQAEKPELVPDLKWFPRIGRQGHAWSRDGSPVVATGDAESCRMLANAIRKEDTGAIGRLRDTKTAFDVASGTAVKIFDQSVDLSTKERVFQTKLLDGKDKGATAWFPMDSLKYLTPKVADIGAVVTIGGPKDLVLFSKSGNNHIGLMVDAMTQGIRALGRQEHGQARAIKGGFSATVIGAHEVGILKALKVRILDGPDKDSEGWVSASAVVKSKPSENQAPAASKAEAAFRLATQFEKTGDKVAAIEYYRKVAERHPNSREAADSLDRIAALGGRP